MSEIERPAAVNNHYVELNGVALYGMDAENYLKMKSKENPEDEKQIKKWIEDILGEKLSEEVDIFENLKSGVILCNLINKFRPNMIDKIHKASSPNLLLRENIQFYLAACLKLGLNKEDLFSVSDLFERKTTHQVLQNLFALGRMVQNIPDNSLPALGKRQRSKTLPVHETAPPKHVSINLPASGSRVSLPTPTPTVSAHSASAAPVPHPNHTAVVSATPASSTVVALPTAAVVDVRLDALIQQIADEIKLPQRDPRVLNTMEILKSNGFDSLSSLNDVTEDELLKIKVPLRFAKIIIRRSVEHMQQQKKAELEQKQGNMFLPFRVINKLLVFSGNSILWFNSLFFGERASNNEIKPLTMV